MLSCVIGVNDKLGGILVKCFSQWYDSSAPSSKCSELHFTIKLRHGEVKMKPKLQNFDVLFTGASK